MRHDLFSWHQCRWQQCCAQRLVTIHIGGLHCASCEGVSEEETSIASSGCPARCLRRTGRLGRPTLKAGFSSLFTRSFRLTSHHWHKKGLRLDLSYYHHVDTSLFFHLVAHNSCFKTRSLLLFQLESLRRNTSSSVPQRSTFPTFPNLT